MAVLGHHRRLTIATTNYSCGDGSALRRPIQWRWWVSIATTNLVAVTSQHCGQHCDYQFCCGDGWALRRPIVPRRRIFMSRPNIIAPANNHYGNEIFLNLLYYCQSWRAAGSDLLHVLASIRKGERNEWFGGKLTNFVDVAWTGCIAKVKCVLQRLCMYR